MTLTLSSKSVGVFEAFYNSVHKPIQLLSASVEIAKPGRLQSGATEIPFEFPLKSKSSERLYETYHGVFVNIVVRRRRCRAVGLLVACTHRPTARAQYMLRCEMKRPMLAKDLIKEQEFLIEYPVREATALRARPAHPHALRPALSHRAAREQEA